VRASGGVAGRMAYSPAEVAAAYGLSRRAIYRAIASGELRAARVCGGRRLLVPAEEAREWVERNLLEAQSVPTLPPRSLQGGRRSRPLQAALAELDGAGRAA
jgi:excisionase family DNA binding protein